MSNHVHHVPGRLRVRVPELKHCAAKAAALRSELIAFSGITEVECHVVTGSVIVYYRPESTDLRPVHRLLGCKQTAPQPWTAETQGSSKLTRAILMFALEKAIERALPALIASVL